jgi:hypothetical protein
MPRSFQFYHHFLLSALLFFILLLAPLPVFLYPWITFQVAVIRNLSFHQGLFFHFCLGLLYAGFNSSLQIGTYSLILCACFVFSYRLKWLFITERIAPSALYAALISTFFHWAEFLLYQIFTSDLSCSWSSMTYGAVMRFFLDLFMSLLIFSWIYFVDFFILKGKKTFITWKEKRELAHVNRPP